ncbi:MAG TPA: hypothetical protein VF834_07095 [Streptosporangiaceae bacterium]
MRTARRGLTTTAAVIAAITVLLPITAQGAVTRVQSAQLRTATVTRTAPTVPAVVLVNQPAAVICSGRKFTVGVWYQQISGGSRAYRVAIYGPRHTRFFYRHGRAPAAHWRFWRVLAGRAGKYHTFYSTHRPGSATWSTYRVVTRARRCAAS